MKGWVTGATIEAIRSKAEVRGVPAEDEGTGSEKPSRGVSQNLREIPQDQLSMSAEDLWSMGPQV